MKKVISTEKRPIKLWLDDIEDGALEQARNLANLPFIFKHIAIMPDSHQGYGMPIGGVMATTDVIVPNAVGVDIGCGMCAVKTNITDITKEQVKEIMGGIRDVVPVGFNWFDKAQDVVREIKKPKTLVIEQQLEKADKQIGTLGGGNHFIEIQKGNDGFVWLMIYSGSRNLGHTVASYYDKVAKELNETYFSQVTSDKELAFLPIRSNEGRDYKIDMEYCVEFALRNRTLMMKRIMDIISKIFPDTVYDGIINKSHNFAAWENHFGKNVIVHRKGATQARKGELGMIPGSQGTKSYIVKGLGNPQSFESCSHGAGRKMSRSKARQELSVEIEKARLDKLGVVHAIRNENDLDEAPSAYKDIAIVMDNQKDLAEIIVELTPLGVVKG